MLGVLKNIIFQLLAGANVMAALLLLLCGLMSHVNPADYPRLVLFCLGFPLLLGLNVAFVFFWLIFKPRRVWLPLVGLFCSITFIYKYCPLNWPSKHPVGALKLVSYNVASFVLSPGDDKGGNAILDYLLASDADIICLQEASVSGTKTKKYMEDAFRKAGYQMALADGEKRLLVCTRLPVIDVERIRYESLGNSSVAVRMLYEGDTLLVVNNHLESYRLTQEDKQHYKHIITDPENPETEDYSRALVQKMEKAVRARGPQADSVLSYVERAGIPSVVLCGDFNDSPISYPCNRFSSRFTDAYSQSGNGPGFSYVQRGFYFRIDHVYVSDDWRTYETYVDRSIHASDHYPLVTYLSKRKK